MSDKSCQEKKTFTDESFLRKVLIYLFLFIYFKLVVKYLVVLVGQKFKGARVCTYELGDSVTCPSGGVVLHQPLHLNQSFRFSATCLAALLKFALSHSQVLNLLVLKLKGFLVYGSRSQLLVTQP